MSDPVIEERRRRPTLEERVASLEARQTFGLRGLVVVALMDFVSLVLVVIIAGNQGTTLDKLHTAVCSNSHTLIEQKVQDKAQTKNSHLYRTFFPSVPTAQLKVVIAQQVARDNQAIQTLKDNCRSI